MTIENKLDDCRNRHGFGSTYFAHLGLISRAWRASGACLRMLTVIRSGGS